jgi:glycosyltransferase involved in cell wall biosynthesis
MPKVLRIINRFNLGGPTFNAALLTHHLPSEYETLLIGGDKEPGEDSGDFIARDLGLDPLILPEMKREISFRDDRKAYIRIKKIIREYKPDIVHTHASKAGAVGRLAAYEMKVPAIVHTFHGHVFHSYFGKMKTGVYKEVERYLARRSTAIVAISEIQKQELTVQLRICVPEKVHVIPLGFDLDRFRAGKDEKRQQFRAEFGLKDEIAIGIIGRIAPVKNHRMFVDVCAEVARVFGEKVRFFIIGDGEERDALRSYIDSRGLRQSYKANNDGAQLEITSWRKDTDVVYAGLDIVCLTSLNEGTPVTLIEAQASGKPVVSTDVGGVRDITSPQTARLVASGDTAGFVNALSELIANQQLRESMSESGWDKVGSSFNYNRLITDMSGLYKQLLDK